MRTLKILSLLMAISIAFVSCKENVPEKNTLKTDANRPVKEKTIIVDVRTTEEWDQDGHADCSVNYPLDELGAKIETLKAYDKVIVVCRSGNRAGSAKMMLEEKGVKNVENQGAWQNIACP